MKNASHRLISSIEELGRLYDLLNQEFYEGTLSKPVITIMPEERKRRNARVLGWFTTKKVWVDEDGARAYELNVTADYADRSLAEIAETLLHEMAHQYAKEHDIEDCSRSGTYHNKNYAGIASEHGLIVEKTEKYGFSKTSLTPEALRCLESYEAGGSLICRRASLDRDEVMDLIEKQVPADTPDRQLVILEMFQRVCEGKLILTKRGFVPKKCSTRKYICPGCGMSIRATRKVNVKCGDCDMIMQCPTEESEEKTSA